MIVLTVKTLDSQNHTFKVDDDITVEEFKAQIAETVNIPPETQRIIYCGRVLQDEVKLKDYDVNGKVVHLVQRPPPSQTPPTTRSSSPQPSTRRGFRGFDGDNAMYLGSMAFPSNLMDSQGIIPPPPTHSLAGSRLNVARRMLRRAEAVISLLENPTARPSEQPSSEEQQEEEVTPIIEARVIVPPGNNETLDEAMVLSAVQNSLFDASSGSIPMTAEITIDSNQESQGSSSDNFAAEGSSSSTPEEAIPSAPAPETSNGTAERSEGANGSGRPLAENASRTTEMAELLTTLNQLQARFAPFLQQYQQFMVEDPVVPTENTRQTQAMLTRVSEVLHFLGHAYHSLSDIIIRVRTPPPRALLCRPILIQHSAVVQAGIPIQVEVAQFNLSAERPSTTSTTTGSSTSAETSTTSTTTASTTSGESTRTTQAQPQPALSLRSFPFIPAAMRMQSIPIEMRAGARPVNVVHSTQRAQNNNNNTAGGTTTASSSTSSSASGSAATGSVPHPTFNIHSLNNSSVEFFMEVTPEGTLNGPPPDFLQSLVHMAGHIMNRITTTAPTSDTNTTTTAQSSSSSTSSTSDTQSSASAAPSAPTQNSQARGNTQTNPTTSTHTRSTPRPHVHLAQQAVQGGFDPFLPCNSHHVTSRRRNQAGRARSTPPEEGEVQGQSLNNLFDEIYSSLRTTYRRRRDGETGEMRREPSARASRAAATATSGDQGPAEAAGSSGSSSGSGGGESGSSGGLPPAFAAFLPSLQSALSGLPSMLHGPTIAEVLQQLPMEGSLENTGDSMITELVVLLSRNLTIIDMIAMNTGNFDPLNGVAGEIQNFFNTRVLNSSNTPESVTAAVDRFMSEMQPFLQNFSRLCVRDDIDLVRSMESLFRQRLPDIINTASNLNTESMRGLVNQCVSLTRTVCTLAMRASANGLQGVEDTFRQIMTSYMQGIPAELQNWTLVTSCTSLRRFLTNLEINEAELEPYIVRTSDVAMAAMPPHSPQAGSSHSGGRSEFEPMEFDEAASSSLLATEAPAQPPLSMDDDSDPLPSIVLGSEPWHSQVPDDWVPIIARDAQRQRRQNPQAPFSDAYLSGMPKKRRKVAESAKPQGSLPQIIAESMRRAVTSTGLSAVAPIEVVSEAAGDSPEIQTAYRSLLRTTMQTAIRDNEDFTPERFPNASTYFKSQ